jgi:4'-phosphopantetheinyl transferase
VTCWVLWMSLGKSAHDSSRVLTHLSQAKQLSLIRKSAQDFEASVAGYRLLYYGLLKGFGISHQLNISEDEQGKPYLTDHPAIYFNITHSKQYVACAISDQPVGIDVEVERDINQALAKRVMSDQEFTRYLALGATKEYFFQLWTLKESYMKYTGEGLRMSLKSMNFMFDDKTVTSNLADVVFHTQQLASDCYLAVCTKETAIKLVKLSQEELSSVRI